MSVQLLRLAATRAATAQKAINAVKTASDAFAKVIAVRQDVARQKEYYQSHYNKNNLAPHAFEHAAIILTADNLVSNQFVNVGQALTKAKMFAERAKIACEKEQCKELDLAAFNAENQARFATADVETARSIRDLAMKTILSLR